MFLFLKKKNFFFKYINILLFLLIFFIPNSFTYYFDGLPFTNKYETLLFTIFFPLTFFFKSYFKSLKILFLLFIIFSLKLILIGNSENGINVKQYFSLNERYEENYIKTYDTFWNKNNSYIQKYSWQNKKNFPLDWTHISKINRKKNDLKKLHINTYNDFENLTMIYDFSFYIVSKKNKNEIIIDTGKSSAVIDKSINIYDKNKNIFQNLRQDNLSRQLFLDKGIYEIKISIKYSGPDWKFNPYLIEENKKISLFKKKIIFSKIDVNENFKIKQNLGNFYEILILTLIILIIIEIYNNYFKKEKKIIIFGITFFIIYLIFDELIKYLLDYFKIIDGVGSFSFAVTNLIIASLCSYKVFIIDKFKGRSSLFLMTSILTCLIVFGNIFFYDIESFSWAGAGDDWTTFQEYSRQIVVDNKWIEAGENIFYFRPGSRYIYAINHILFGMSAFSYKILNIWSILLCSYLLIKILIHLRCDQFLSHLAGILILSIYTGDNFRWILTVGLSEYYAMILLIIKIYFIIVKKDLHTIDYFFIVLLGTIQIWLREEHAPVVMSLIFLIGFKNTKYKEEILLNYFSALKIFLIKNFKIIFLYTLLIILGFSSIFIRNYFVGGSIGLFDIQAVKTLTKEESILITYYHVFSRLIFGVDQYFPTLPKIYSVFNIFAIFISFKIILNYRKFYYFNFGLPIVLFSIIFPYFFVENIAYTPRYAIHLLPVSILITFIFLNNYLNIKNDKNFNIRI